MNRLQPYSAVLVCAFLQFVAFLFALSFALGGEWKSALGAFIVALAAYGFGRNELAEVRRERERRFTSPPFTTADKRGFPPQPRRGIR